jgi:hypothetical protein
VVQLEPKLEARGADLCGVAAWVVALAVLDAGLVALAVLDAADRVIEEPQPKQQSAAAPTTSGPPSRLLA